MDKKSDFTVPINPKIEIVTLADLKDGGYADRYRKNTEVDPDQSFGENTAQKIYDRKNAEYTHPFYKCPKCEDGENLYNSLHESYIECRNCNIVFRKGKE